MSQLERERVIIEHIKIEGSIHHNALIRKIVPVYMAKSTFEKVRDDLVEKQIISMKMSKNRKIYSINENVEGKSFQKIEQRTNQLFHDIKMRIRKIETDYIHKDNSEKINIAYRVIDELLRIDNGFTILDSIKNPKKTLYKDEHMDIQELINQVLEIVKKDKSSQMNIAAVISSLSINNVKN
jgi:hypothetical protein